LACLLAGVAALVGVPHGIDTGRAAYQGIATVAAAEPDGEDQDASYAWLFDDRGRLTGIRRADGSVQPLKFVYPSERAAMPTGILEQRDGQEIRRPLTAAERLEMKKAWDFWRTKGKNDPEHWMPLDAEAAPEPQGAPREAARPDEWTIGTVGQPPPELGLDPFYEKCVDSGGIHVISSSAVSDEALYEAARIAREMLKNRPDIRDEMIRRGFGRIAIIGIREQPSDIPEVANANPTQQEQVRKNARGRGWGPTDAQKVTVACEENLVRWLEDEDDQTGISVLVHELGHAVHATLETLEPETIEQVKACYENAQEAGIWNARYAMENWMEYFAESSQAWHGSNHPERGNAMQNHVNTPKQLRERDPEMADILTRIYGEHPWQWEGTKRIPHNRGRPLTQGR
jgi:hypothetical protein